MGDSIIFPELGISNPLQADRVAVHSLPATGKSLMLLSAVTLTDEKLCRLVGRWRSGRQIVTLGLLASLDPISRVT